MLKRNDNYRSTRNCYPNKNTKIEYLVVHYTGCFAPAINFCKSQMNNDLGGSAHDFVDDTSWYNAIEHKHGAWHCGGGTSYGCTNYNSIGIEMVAEPYKLPSAKTIENTSEIVAYYMKLYNVPISKVIRHYDCNSIRKACPYGMHGANNSEWNKFIQKVLGYYNKTIASTPATSTTTSALYRVKDSKGIQLGAFSILDNAKSFAQSKQAIVYDANGNVVISYVPVVNNYTRYAEKGIFTFNTAVTVRTAPEENAKTNVVYYAGESVNYDYVWLNKDNYNWVEYTRNNGQKGYLKIKDLSTGISYGYAK